MGALRDILQRLYRCRTGIKCSGERGSHPDAFGSSLRVFQVVPAAGDKDCGYYEPQNEQAQVGKPDKLWQHWHVVTSS